MNQSYTVHLSTVIFFFFTHLFAFFPHLCDLPSLSEKSFRDCLLSRFFMWHLLWLSVMQLRHYLFIGTLNPMLQRLTAGESSLGNRTNTTSLSLSSKHLNVILLNQHALGTLKMHQCLNSASLINWLILHSKCSDLQTKTMFLMPFEPSCLIFWWTLPFIHFVCVPAVSQYTNAFAITQLCGVLCAPWNGLIMDRHKGKPRAEGNTMTLILM